MTVCVCCTSIAFELEGTGETVEVFTTRPDTLMGVTYIVLAPEHPLTAKVATPDRLEVRVRVLAACVWMLKSSCGIV